MESKKSLLFAWERFKGFWNQYKKSRRGMLGLIIIALFGVIAVAAPVLSPLDPMEPKWPGYYPGGDQPKLCGKLAVPIWYKSLLGMQSLPENMEAIEDHELALPETFDKWKLETSQTGYDVTVQYNPTGGTLDDGCIEIVYKRDATQQLPSGGKFTIILGREFVFPYEDSPKSIFFHYSVKLENRTLLAAFPLGVTTSYRRGTEPQSMTVKSQAWPILQVADKWYSKSGYTQGEVGPIEEDIFTGSGNYTHQITLTITDDREGSNADVTVYVDNVQSLLYGKAFGLLGTSSIPLSSPRDLFTMLLYGTRISFMIGLLTAILSVAIGLAVGLVSGYVRGLVDEGLMRFADFLLVLPGLPLLIVLVTVLGRSIWNIVGVLIFMGWMGFSRTVRSMVLSLRERPFIESAKAAGAGTFYVIYRHILPNVFALVYISLATAVPGAIISEASLAWLGLGDITIPSWGIMLYDFSATQTAIVKGLGEYWFWVIPPGVAIAVMAMAFILMGFALDEILNPKLRQRR
jgi:peptide/nickel transport system permease protein